MAFATPKFPNSSKIHLFSFDPSCISFERVADVDDDDNHIDDMMMMFNWPLPVRYLNEKCQ